MPAACRKLVIDRGGPMLQLTAPSPTRAAPLRCIPPGLPYAFAFALGSAPPLAARIVLGEVTLIDVTSGTDGSHGRDDWFAQRVPAIPPVTGPVRVAGVSPGDMLDVEVLAIEPGDAAMGVPLMVTIAAATGDAGRGPDVVQAAVPDGGVVRIAARRREGLLSFGPVLAGRQTGGDLLWTPVAARVSVRLSVSRPWDG
jgi:hypothetical protein